MKIFVYGTLKRGQSNHPHFLKHQEFIGKAISIRPYMMKDVGGFPVVFENNQGHHIEGEIYEVNDEAIVSLDRLEGNGRMYERAYHGFDLDGSGPTEAMMYTGVPKYWRNGTNLPEVPVTSRGTYDWAPWRIRSQGDTL